MDGEALETQPSGAGAKQEKAINIARIDQVDERFRNYFASYTENQLAKIEIDNVVALNRQGVFLYRLINGQERIAHVIWIHNNPEMILPLYKAIDAEQWQKLQFQPEVIERTNRVLLKSYQRALDFYDWKDKPRGFIVEGSTNFGMEAGNIGGIRVSFTEIKPLIRAIEEDDVQEIERHQVHLAASMVHELTHIERDDGLVSQVKTEIVSHIMQFMFDPKGNEIFNQELDSALDVTAKTRRPEGKQKILDLHAKAQYIALLLTAYKLSETSGSIRALLKSDRDPSKLNALKKLRDLIGDVELKTMRESLLEEFMTIGNDKLLKNKLLKMFFLAKQKLGIRDRIIEEL